MKRLTGAERYNISVFQEKPFWMLCHINLLTINIGAGYCSIVPENRLDHALFESDSCMLLGHRFVFNDNCCHLTFADEHLVVCQINLLAIWLNKHVFSTAASQRILNDCISLIECKYLDTATTTLILLRLILWSKWL